MYVSHNPNFWGTRRWSMWECAVGILRNDCKYQREHSRMRMIAKLAENALHRHRRTARQSNERKALNTDSLDAPLWMWISDDDTFSDGDSDASSTLEPRWQVVSGKNGEEPFVGCCQKALRPFMTWRPCLMPMYVRHSSTVAYHFIISYPIPPVYVMQICRQPMSISYRQGELSLLQGTPATM
jgi:hypothetical protein